MASAGAFGSPYRTFSVCPSLSGPVRPPSLGRPPLFRGYASQIVGVTAILDWSRPTERRAGLPIHSAPLPIRLTGTVTLRPSPLGIGLRPPTRTCRLRPLRPSPRWRRSSLLTAPSAEYNFPTTSMTECGRRPGPWSVPRRSCARSGTFGRSTAGAKTSRLGSAPNWRGVFLERASLERCTLLSVRTEHRPSVQSHLSLSACRSRSTTSGSSSGRLPGAPPWNGPTAVDPLRHCLTRTPGATAPV